MFKTFLLPMPTLFLGLTSLTKFSTSLPQIHSKCGLQPVQQCCLCQFFLLREMAPHTLPLLKCGSLPWESIFRDFPWSLPWTSISIFLELLQHGCLPWSHKPCQQTCSNAPLSTGSQVQPGACSSMSFPHGHNLHLWTSTCSFVGSYRGCKLISLLLCCSSWAGGSQLLHHDFHQAAEESFL